MEERDSTAPAATGPDWTTPRPVDETYWVVPGRLLVGAHPGSRSRAQAMDRLRRFLEAGVTCFLDLTESTESPGYEMLLPFETPTGRRVEYLREPIVDHGVPANRETMARIIAMLDAALESGHIVYLHCRAGIGRSAMTAGCWLAERRGSGDAALLELADLWQQAAQSSRWPRVPETQEQVEFVRTWTAGDIASGAHAGEGWGTGAGIAMDAAERLRGAWHGAALGDALGLACSRKPTNASVDGPLVWTQHTALTLCLAESLLAKGRCDARDQIERYLRWQRDGHLSATGQPGVPTPDVAGALANYRWRGLATAGSHDPRDRTTAALPRVIAAVLHTLSDPAAAVALAGQCARTTHQSPIVIDACRYYGAMLVGALRGAPVDTVLGGLYEPVPGLWSARPLKPAVVSMAVAVEPPRSDEAAGKKPASHGAVDALARARAAVAQAGGFGETLRRACESAAELAVEAAIAGTLFGALHGAAAIPPARLAGLARRDLLESFAARLCTVDRGGAGT